MVEMSISFTTGTGMTNLKHNNRELTAKEFNEPAHKHIKRDLSQNNIVIKQESLDEVYKREFGEALEKYNSKQKRKDRIITDYKNHVYHSKSLDLQREFIVALGKKSDWDNLSQEMKQQAGEKIAEYIREFEVRHPQLKVFNAVVHLDEAGAPHAHFNIVPVATGYKNGLEKQPSFSKALYQEGNHTKGRGQYRQFRKEEVAKLEEKLKELGYDRKIVGTNNIKDMHEYKEIVSKAKDEMAKIDLKATEKLSELSRLESDIKGRSDDLEALEGEIRAYERGLNVGREFSNGWRTKFPGELKTTLFGREYIRLDPEIYNNARWGFVYQENKFREYEHKIREIRLELNNDRKARLAVIRERDNLREQINDLKVQNKWLERRNQELYERLDLVSRKLGIWRREAKKVMSAKDFKAWMKYLNRFVPLKPVIETVKVVKKVIDKGRSI